MRALLLLPLLLVSGCISLLPEPPPPPRTYVLEAQNVTELEGAPIDAVIAIAQPNGERAILGADLVLRSGDTIAYVGQAQWSNRASDALQAMLAETLIRQGRFRASTRSGEARADYEIRWEVLDFEVREQTTARFAADVRLVAQGRQIIASRLIVAEVPVDGGQLTANAVAQALARAAREGSARIGEFAAGAAAEAEASAATE
ncbi:MAG: ABC-type transport auxiliary lipoprotein family protein [Hyphomonadaceae bacterium]